MHAAPEGKVLASQIVLSKSEMKLQFIVTQIETKPYDGFQYE